MEFKTVKLKMIDRSEKFEVGRQTKWRTKLLYDEDKNSLPN